MKTLFISDLHLDENLPCLTKLFEYFIAEHAIHAEQIFILGDLFNHWLGDDVISDYHRYIASLFQSLVSKNIQLYFLSGNRDFLLGHSYAKLAGFQLIEEPYVLELFGKRILLVHGDRECWEDKWHQIYRKYTDSKWLRRLFLALPLSFRYKVANKLKQNSYSSMNLVHSLTDVSPAALTELYQKHAVDMIIHGHTHNPIIEYSINQKFQQSRIVLSDWGKQGNYLQVFSEEDYSLVYFPKEA